MNKEESNRQVSEEELTPAEVKTDIRPFQQMDDVLTNLRTAEDAVEYFERLKAVALRQTRYTDWVDQGGKPYLMGSGAERMAAPFELSWEILGRESIEEKDDKGKYYIYATTIKVCNKSGRCITVTGYASTRDDFFAKKKIYKDNGRYEMGYKELSEISKIDIMKKSETNGIQKGIKKMLGIRNITWEDVRRAGIKVGKIAKVTYKEGKSKKGSKKTYNNDNNGEYKEKYPEKKITLKQLGLLRGKIKAYEQATGKKGMKEKFRKAMGLDDLADMKRGQLQEKLKEIEEGMKPNKEKENGETEE